MGRTGGAERRGYRAAVKSLIVRLDSAVTALSESIGLLFFGAILGPPVLLSLFFALRTSLRPIELPEDSIVAVLLAATGVTSALASVCFSYSRAAADEDSQVAGLDAGRLFLGATTLLLIALGTHFVTYISADPSTVADSSFYRWGLGSAFQIGPRYGPALAALGVLRLYLHLLRLTGKSMANVERSRKEQPTAGAIDKEPSLAEREGAS